ncbi:MAG TPA: SRPBCC family protein [Pyrinomonadaceae bacterium]|jgi:ligand-binding SRPBCC domain-containing protein
MRFVKETVIRAAPEKVFGFHLLPDAFERLVPPWEKVKIIQKADITRIGSRAIIESKLFGFFKVRWVAEHTRYEPPRMFEDVQISGPFKSWRHQHFVEPHAEGALLKDEIEFEPPFSIIGKAVAPTFIISKLEKMFAYRHEVTRKWAEEN